MMCEEADRFRLICPRPKGWYAPQCRHPLSASSNGTPYNNVGTEISENPLNLKGYILASSLKIVSSFSVKRFFFISREPFVTSMKAVTLFINCVKYLPHYLLFCDTFLWHYSHSVLNGYIFPIIRIEKGVG